MADEPYQVGSKKRGTAKIIQPGRTKRSIAISERRTRRAKKEREPKSGIQMAMGPSAGEGALYNASRSEFGNSNTPPSPYMRPAWDSEAEGAIQTIADDLGNEIAKSAQRQARKRAKG